MTVTTYTIVPRSRRYWIETIATDGSRQSFERFDTEEAAVRRLRELQAQQGIVGQWDPPPLPRRGWMR